MGLRVQGFGVLDFGLGLGPVSESEDVVENELESLS